MLGVVRSPEQSVATGFDFNTYGIQWPSGGLMWWAWAD
jgi:hypothetical protein